MSKICIVMLCLVGLAMAAPQSAPQARALQLDPVCLLSPIADPTQNCKNVSVRWYFDAVDGDCEDFVYSGCGGSENVFESEFACEVRCENVHDRMNSFESAESAESVEVRCNNFSLKWYYDARTRDCEKILYSGCGGSKNLFNSENACERLCDYDNFDSYESDEDFHDYYPLPTYKYFSIGK
ncbi:boophilin-H2 [Daphnia magna]|uniref:boophilin-H2 n=1 Tax=Daphnia magna TaxID=35525 RepID=UPI001E1BDB60|nr:boophilin-H2 [Daphnia magna]